MTTVGPILRCLAALLLVLLAPDDALSSPSDSETDFTDMFMTHQEEYERAARQLREEVPGSVAEDVRIVEELDWKRKTLFQAFLDASQKNRDEEAALTLEFSKKYQELVTDGIRRLTREGTRLIENGMYPDAAGLLEGVLRVAPEHEAAIRDLSRLSFDWSVDLLEAGDQAGAAEKREQFRRWCRLAENCLTCGKDRRQIWFDNGKRWCRKGSDENDPKAVTTGIGYFERLRFFDKNYPDLTREMAECRSFFTDCSDNLEKAVTLFRDNRVTEARQKLKEIRSNATGTCFKTIARQRKQYFDDGVFAFQQYEFEKALSALRSAQFISADEPDEIITAYIGTAEQLLDAKRLYENEKFKEAIHLFRKSRAHSLGDETAHMRFSDLYLKKFCESLQEQADDLYENFMKYPAPYKDYLLLISAFEEASVACGSQVNTPYEQLMKNARTEYLKRHYADGERLRKDYNLADAWCHYKAVEKMDPEYRNVHKIITAIEGRLKESREEPKCRI